MNGGMARTGTEILSDLPEEHGPAREQAILEAVEAREIAPLRWVDVKSTVAGHAATLRVLEDALRLGTAEDSFRVTVSPRTEQQIADMLRASLQTRKIVNLVWDQAAVRVTPSVLPPDAFMGRTTRMKRHHDLVEMKRAGRPGLIENVGKHWVLSNRIASLSSTAANYGWFDTGAPDVENGYRLWQPLGIKHNLEHCDYSQVVRLVQSQAIVDGETMELAELLRDPLLSALVSDEGPLMRVRLPVPERDPIDNVPIAPALTANGAGPSAPLAFEVDSPPPSKPLLRQGARGLDVIRLQKALNQNGAFPALLPDGFFGPATTGALNRFQTARGLPATGQTDIETWIALNA